MVIVAFRESQLASTVWVHENLMRTSTVCLTDSFSSCFFHSERPVCLALIVLVAPLRSSVTADTSNNVQTMAEKTNRK